MNEDIMEQFKKLKIADEEQVNQIEKEKAEAAERRTKQNNARAAQYHLGSQSYHTSTASKKYARRKTGKDMPKATAPYNFVPMVPVVLPSPLSQGRDWMHLSETECREAYKEYICDQKTYSGTVNLTLTNLTPLFIGAGEGDEFFSPTGKNKPIIPGSTLRGMTRSLFKIVTAGAMRRNEDFTDRHLYFRCLMAPKSMPQLNELHDYYVERISTERKDKNGKKVTGKKTKAGFLFRKTKEQIYYISPCHEIHSIKREEYGKSVDSDSYVDWDDKEHAAYILTGNQSNKRYIRYIDNPDWSIEYPVPDAVIQDYRDDKNRRGVNLLDEKSKNTKVKTDAQKFAQRDDIDFLAPCFYVMEDNQITAFGHGRSFRIPYRHSIGDRINKNLENETVIDFTDAVFGRKELWAGRVSFEDAPLEGVPKYASKGYIKPLMGPNPTSYQLYLKQTGYPPAHWDSLDATEVRGYKMYWHQKIKNTDWQADYASNLDTLTKEIHPLAPNNAFHGKIHFRNLTAIELGALLKVFHLGTADNDIVYKLGMGKSLGLGSMRIHTELSLDSGGRYTALFAQNAWKTSETVGDAATFLKAFSKYAQQHLGKEQEAYQKSLDTLALLMDWKHTELPDWQQRVAMMSQGVQKAKNGHGKASVQGGVDLRFIKKYMLPEPEEVVNHDGKKERNGK